MGKRKSVRTRGKLQFSKYFQKFSKGENVAVIIEDSLQPRFPKRLQGRTGIIAGKRGKSQIVKIRDSSKEKIFLIEPIHLRKIAGGHNDKE